MPILDNLIQSKLTTRKNFHLISLTPADSISTLFVDPFSLGRKRCNILDQQLIFLLQFDKKIHQLDKLSHSQTYPTLRTMSFFPITIDFLIKNIKIFALHDKIALFAVSAASPSCSLLQCSPATSRRISSASLLRSDSADQPTPSSDCSKPVAREKRLPIINPLVRLPMWPSKLSFVIFLSFSPYNRILRKYGFHQKFFVKVLGGNICFGSP